MKSRSGTDDLLVVVGGFGAHQNMVEVVEQYDPKTEEWTNLPVSDLDLWLRASVMWDGYTQFIPFLYINMCFSSF